MNNKESYQLRYDKHYPWNRSTLLEDELDALEYQWSTSRIQQPENLALGVLCKQDVYSSGSKIFLQIDVWKGLWKIGM